MKALLSILACTTVLFQLCAADIYVDYEKGSAKNSGTKDAPFDRFGTAIRK